jgi:hypothetical protein
MDNNKIVEIVVSSIATVGLLGFLYTVIKKDRPKYQYRATPENMEEDSNGYTPYNPNFGRGGKTKRKKKQSKKNK